MSRNYKFKNPSGIYFISFATINWIDIFVREVYFSLIVDSLVYCQKNKGLILHAFCIMPSHLHLIFSSSLDDPSGFMRDFKTFTSKELQKHILSNPQESRKEWIEIAMKNAARTKSNVKNMQFWQQNNKAIELWSNVVLDQKLDYIHNNPVNSGFVSSPEHWKYSSASSYILGYGQIEIDKLC